MSHFVGIDWAMEKHDICIQTEDGRVITELTISHNLEGFELLHCHVEKLDDIKILIERSDGLLVDWLLQQAWSVYMLHPTILNCRRPRRSKDDRGDAFLLAYLLRVGDPDCHPITRPSPLVQALKQAAISYDNLSRSHRQYTNRLIYTLRQFYPTAILAFPSVDSLTCLDFLEKYPTPSAARALSIDEVDDFLRQHHYSARTKCLPGIYAGLQANMPDAAFPDALAAPSSSVGRRNTLWYRVRMLITRLWNRWQRLTLDKRRNDLDGTNNACERVSVLLAGGLKNAIAPCATTNAASPSAMSSPRPRVWAHALASMTWLNSMSDTFGERGDCAPSLLFSHSWNRHTKTT